MTEVTVDHVAFVVSSIELAQKRLHGMLASPGEIEDFPAEGTRECYIGAPGSAARLLLMQPTGDGPYADSLAKRGPGLHHVALAVLDLAAFLADVVDRSGWLVHPRSFHTVSAHKTAWLARPGVEALIEVMEVKSLPRDAPAIDSVIIAGLDARPALAAIFGDSLPVHAGPRSGVTVGEYFVSAPEDIVTDAPPSAPFE